MPTAREIQRNMRCVAHALAQQEIEGLKVSKATIEDRERAAAANLSRRRYPQHPLPFEYMKPSEALAAHRAALRELVSHYSVTHPRVYGSVLTGKDDEESGLDLLVDPTSSTTLFTLAGLEDEAQRLLGVQVSVLTPKDLPTKFRSIHCASLRSG